VIRTRTRLVRADGTDWAWRLSLKVCGGRDSLTARLLVNASGPWVAGGAERALRRPRPAPVPLLDAATLSSNGDSAAHLSASEDRRAGFAIPYERDFTLIGTTQEAYPAAPWRRAPTALLPCAPRRARFCAIRSPQAC
jgi:glycerol-3-phosphate dehydrogenase